MIHSSTLEFLIAVFLFRAVDGCNSINLMLELEALKEINVC